MKKYTVLIFVSLTPLITFAQKKLPIWVTEEFQNSKLSLKYSFANFVKPNYLMADFNGDKIDDVAVLISENNTNKKGILILFGENKKYTILGAGMSFGNGSDNFMWMKGWKVYNEKIAFQTQINSDGDLIGSKKMKLKNHGISAWDVVDGEPNSGGIIYWTGLKFIWIQQGE
ncbi:hypothetical protein ACPPVU_00485 [Mucilaginibacter sp. McL0603]|uniref:hypothetical protein n=1 Tax=Mucilaginibacter sp. McL0603 TaxID=3415670 RepID=UPI003CE95612